MSLKKVVLPSLCFVMSLNGYARIPGRGSSTSVASRTGASNHVSRADTPSITTPGVIVSEGSSNSCKANDTKGYVSQSFLRQITDPNVPESDIIKVVETKPGVYGIKMNKYFSTCTDLEFEVREVDSNYFVRVKNRFHFNRSNVTLKKGEDFNKLSDSEKYYRCVEKAGMLKEGSFNWSKAEQADGITYGTATKNPFRIDTRDGEESVRIYYASPLATEYPKDFPAGNINSKPSDWKCMSYENFNQKSEKRLFTSHRDQVYDRAMQVCQTQSAEKIYRELRNLEKSSAGNFQGLKRDLEKAFDKAQEKRVDKIYERMAEIEKRMKDKKDLSRDDIKDLGGEYSDLALELNKIVLEPSVHRITALLEKRKEVSDKQKKGIDKQIKRLNEKISHFSREHPSSSKGSISKIYDRLQEQGLVDDARNIEGLRLASHFYGRVYDRHGKIGTKDKRGSALTIKKAENDIESSMKSFESKHLNHWEEVYAVKHGEIEPIESTRIYVQNEYARMQRDGQTFQQKERKYTMQYCGNNMLGMPMNPYRCKKWMSGQGQRYKKFKAIMSHHQNNINWSANKYQQYIGLYQAYKLNNQNREPSSNSGFTFYGGNNGPMEDSNFGFMNPDMVGTDTLYNMGMPQMGMRNMSNSFMMR